MLFKNSEHWLENNDSLLKKVHLIHTVTGLGFEYKTWEREKKRDRDLDLFWMKIAINDIDLIFDVAALSLVIPCLCRQR